MKQLNQFSRHGEQGPLAQESATFSAGQSTDFSSATRVGRGGHWTGLTQAALAGLVLLCLAPSGFADPGDRVKVPLSDPARPASLEATLINGGITVRGYEGKEVIVEWRGESDAAEEGRHKAKENPRAQGLHRIGGTGNDLTIDEDKNNIKINAGWSQEIHLNIQVPVNTSLRLKCINDGDIVVEHVSGDLEIENVNGAIKLKNVSGSVVAHALNEEVSASLLQVTPNKSMSFTSMNGDVDVTLPANLKARVKVKSNNGEIYSDFDIKMEGKASAVNESHSKDGKFSIKVDKTMSGSINGGGPEIVFQTFNGDIFIRKSK